jgi:exopolysaccharide biosynthesis polyprenyl glycosylphosphotransferase
VIKELSLPTAPELDSGLTLATAKPAFPVFEVFSRRRLLLLGGDTVIILAAIALVQHRTDWWPVDMGLLSGLAIYLTWIAILDVKGFYNFRRFMPFHRRSYELSKATSLAAVFTSALFFLFPFLPSSRSLILISALVIGVSLLCWRTIYHRLLPLPEFRRRVLVVGAGNAGTHAAQEMLGNPKLGYEVVGFVDDDQNKLDREVSGARVLASGPQLPEVVRRHRVDAIVLAISGQVGERTLHAIGDCVEMGCEVLNVSKLSERISGRIPVPFIDHGWFISEVKEADRNLYSAVKRLLDIILSLTGLVLLGPVLPVLALLIKLDSPGPVLYSQMRVGLKGRPFKIHKFRTMVANAERDGAQWAKTNDSRITRLGQFLRLTRLDELPQLINILRGEMSLIGPRPERPEFVDELAKQIPFYNRRHMVLPGLTGWAQVNYPYGASWEDSLQKLQYDLFYIKNRSLFLDLEILLRTISVVINKTGAR